MSDVQRTAREVQRSQSEEFWRERSVEQVFEHAYALGHDAAYDKALTEVGFDYNESYVTISRLERERDEALAAVERLREDLRVADRQFTRLKESSGKADSERIEALSVLALAKEAYGTDDLDPILTGVDASTLKRVRAEAFDEGRFAVIEYAVAHVVDEPDELAGFIDQHVVAVGGAKLRNPYREDES